MDGMHVSPIPHSVGLASKQAHAVLRRPNHPRRPSPKDSVSLPGFKRRKLSHSPTPAVKTQVTLKSKSSGSGSDESASKWFNNVNEHVAQSARNFSEQDDEPPFFMTSQPSVLPRMFTVSDNSRAFGVQSRFDSENEDLRGVIDDLTVENKRLKTILRARASQRESPINDTQDKLFEVRMHGLPPEKRRELEFLLKNFATSIHSSAPSAPGSTTESGVSSTVLRANNLKQPKTDSGYVSNSNSGAMSHGENQRPRPLPTTSRGVKDTGIKNHLRDIPDTLMPRQTPMVISDRAKMVLVVRRLEQLFTGRTAAPGDHAHPLQQQEVSKSAAHADARCGQKRKLEGSREAHILPADSKVNLDYMDAEFPERKPSTTKISDNSDSLNIGGTASISRPSSPDQRPTRPLDLDIHRAQIAAENIQYIRHLGLSSPHIGQSGDNNGPWMYLNLLVNMAQLHNFNVTPELVRRAIKKLSSKFELSKDGHKVRWIGGPEGTVFSKEEERALQNVETTNHQGPESTEEGGASASSKRSKTDSNSNPVGSKGGSDDKTSGNQTSATSKLQASTGLTSVPLSTNLSRQASSFDYKPIVYREKILGNGESYLQDSDSSLDSPPDDTSRLAHALSKSNLNQQRQSESGILTFFNNPHFYSDYSGDKMPNNMKAGKFAVLGETIGLPSPIEYSESPLRYHDACYFTPRFAPAPYQSEKDESTLNFSLAPLSGCGEDETQPMEMIASGLGGVVPEDNFALDVKISLVEAEDEPTPPIIRRVPLTGTEIAPEFNYIGLSCRQISLLPSRLPPPTYVFFTSSSSSGNCGTEDSDDDDDEDEEDSDETSSAVDEENPAPSGFLARWATRGSSDIFDGADSDQDDSSVDMLAEARAADPTRIAEQERQYLINQPGGGAAAGSLAATVGASRTTPSIDGGASDRVEVESNGMVASDDDDGDGDGDGDGDDYDDDDDDADADDDE